ncbi:MAG: ATP-binding protein [Acidimicrobiia bacterium]
MTKRVAAWLVGLSGTALVTGGCRLLDDRIGTNVTGALLLVPIVVASVLGGWRVGVRVAFIAAIGYSLAFLVPFGHVHVGLTRDVLVLIVFVTIAFGVGVVADRRRDEPFEQAPANAGGELLLRAVSHDLRNPLSTIRAASSDLLTGVHEDDDGRRTELLGLVLSESERLDRIVGNLLSASRVRAGALVPSAQAESLPDVLTGSLRRLGRLRTAPILLDLEPSLPDVLIDAVQIDQVVTNLVENASRWSPPEQPIVISARRRDAAVEVAVTDHGPGFPLGSGAEVFDVFRSSSGSSGLGLAVCKAVVEAHGGTIGIDEVSTVRGARVWFTLPIAEL